MDIDHLTVKLAIKFDEVALLMQIHIKRVKIKLKSS